MHLLVALIHVDGLGVAAHHLADDGSQGLRRLAQSVHADVLGLHDARAVLEAQQPAEQMRQDRQVPRRRRAHEANAARKYLQQLAAFNLEAFPRGLLEITAQALGAHLAESGLRIAPGVRMDFGTDDISFSLSAAISNAELNALFASAWGRETHDDRGHDFGPMLRRSLACACARSSGRLVGFVNLAWDGGVHAFISEAVVHRDFQKRGVGSRLVRMAIEAARQSEAEWLHVDFEPHLENFYASCGFQPTTAGLMRLG